MTQSTVRSVSLGTFLVVMLVLRVTFPAWEWVYFGALLAVAAIVATTLAEPHKTSGWQYTTKEEMDEPQRVAARNQYAWLSSIALALVVASALIPIMELPGKDGSLKVGTNVASTSEGDIEGVTFVDHEGGQRLDTKRLKRVLGDLRQDVDSLRGRKPADWLLVNNCGKTKPCGCPTEYVPVADSGGPDLNDGTTGAAMRLCIRGK